MRLLIRLGLFVSAAEVLGGLDEGEPFTFFAPSDRAIERLQRQLQARAYVFEMLRACVYEDMCAVYA